MTVGELIEELGKMPANLRIIIDEPEQNEAECSCIVSKSIPIWSNDEIIGTEQVVFIG